MRNRGFAILTTFLVGLFPLLARAEELPAFDEAVTHGFSAVAFITTNLEFMKDWQTPRENSPKITPKNTLKPGEQALLRVVFTRASQPGEEVSLDCGVTVSLEGKQLQKAEPVLCVNMVMPENTKDVFLTGLEVNITAEAEDIGKWHVFDIVIKDRKTGRQVTPKVGYLTVAAEGGS